LRGTKLKLSAVPKEQMLINIQNIHIQSVKSLSDQGIQTDILRLDLIHPVISGNKWFKLKYYLDEAIAANASKLASFGGAYSNHIVAMALAGKQSGIPTIGFIRGDDNTSVSPTLEEAVSYGMKLQFINRTDYRDKKQIQDTYHQSGWYWIPEGGYGLLGAKGAADILHVLDTSSYSHIICAVGTGTMMAGLIIGAKPSQEIIGISVLKNHFSITKEIEQLIDLSPEKKPAFQCLHGYDWGGYAKHTPDLLSFMQQFWLAEKIPSDFVYIAKMIYAAHDLIQKNFFPAGSRLLLIHSGGLQGNRSLAPDILPF
jgi:1-aminocyclopropane-1-carboxylate deaminase